MTAISSECPRCGTIAKSGQMSCCGRGGSWFKSCGGAGNTKLQHTWHEGIQACKARLQSKTVVGHQLNGGKQKSIHSSQGAGMANNKAGIAATKTFVFTSASTPMSDTTSIVTSSYTPDNVSITTPAHTLVMNTPTTTFMISSTHTSASTSIIEGYVNLLKITVHINVLLIFW